MSAAVLRFIHTADLHLERPVTGVANPPEPLRNLLIDAPLRAAENVFDTALRENVDFLALAGDVLDPRLAGARGIAFLREQFGRLAESGIAVYWAGGTVDPPQSWPDSVRLPSNVYVFTSKNAKSLDHCRNEAPVATILGKAANSEGRIKPADFRDAAKDNITVAIAHAQFDANDLNVPGIDYWALGGDHQRRTLPASVAVQYAGTTQGRTSNDVGPHGCNLVEFNANGQAVTKFVPTDVVRWYDERITAPENASREKLQRLLSDRMLDLVANGSGRTLLVRWTISADAKLAGQLRRGDLTNDLVGWLHDEFGNEESSAWTVSLDIEPPTALPQAWYDEDTILGDFLRTVREDDSSEAAACDLLSLLPAEWAESELASAVQINDTKAQSRLLRDVAILGADLLRGEEDAA